MANPIPEGFRTVTPHLIVDDAGKALELYQKAFGAEEICRMGGPGGCIMHAEIKIGNSTVMLCDEMEGMTSKDPKGLGGSPVTMHIYTEDCDALQAQAVAAGAEITMPMQDMFWGDRYGKVTDPFGHEWSFATHIKDVTPEEMQEAAKQVFG